MNGTIEEVLSGVESDIIGELMGRDKELSCPYILIRAGANVTGWIFRYEAIVT